MYKGGIVVIISRELDLEIHVAAGLMEIVFKNTIQDMTHPLVTLCFDSKNMSYFVNTFLNY